MTACSTDSDIPIFDRNLMQYSVTWRFKESRGLTFASDLAQYEDRKNRLMSQDAGPREIRLGGNAFDGFPAQHSRHHSGAVSLEITDTGMTH